MPNANRDRELRGAALSLPSSGRHILAHYDDETIVVYPAYPPAIAELAVAHQRFG